MLFRILIILLAIQLFASYETAQCKIVGFRIYQDQYDFEGGSSKIYYPLFQVNLIYPGGTVELFNQTQQSPVVRLNQDKTLSYKLSLTKAEDTFSLFRSLGSIHTCYYDDVNNIFWERPYPEITFGLVITMFMALIAGIVFGINF